MLIDMQITLHLDRQADVAMAGDLLEHMIEESQSRGDMAATAFIEVHLHQDIGLGGGAMDPAGTRLGFQETVDLAP